MTDYELALFVSHTSEWADPHQLEAEIMEALETNQQPSRRTNNMATITNEKTGRRQTLVHISRENYEYDPREYLDTEGKIENWAHDDRKVIEEDVPARYVTVYDVGQLYGGPEEGGWWYYHYEAVCSIRLIDEGDTKEIGRVISFLKPRYASYGSITSTRGGQLYEFIAEYEQGENETKGRPHYE